MTTREPGPDLRSFRTAAERRIERQEGLEAGSGRQARQGGPYLGKLTDHIRTSVGNVIHLPSIIRLKVQLARTARASSRRPAAGRLPAPGRGL